MDGRTPISTIRKNSKKKYIKYTNRTKEKNKWINTQNPKGLNGWKRRRKIPVYFQKCFLPVLVTFLFAPLDRLHFYSSVHGSSLSVIPLLWHLLKLGFRINEHIGPSLLRLLSWFETKADCLMYIFGSVGPAPDIRQAPVTSGRGPEEF